MENKHSLGWHLSNEGLELKGNYHNLLSSLLLGVQDTHRYVLVSDETKAGARTRIVALRGQLDRIEVLFE